VRRNLIAYKRNFVTSIVRLKFDEIENDYMRSIQEAGLNTTVVGPGETDQIIGGPEH
jgi:hypothetical protein